MLKFLVAFGVGILLLVAVALGPTLFRGPRISSLSATSVRVESIPKPRPRSTVIVGGSRSRSSSWGSSSSSGRYSSGGGFSSGK